MKFKMFIIRHILMTYTLKIVYNIIIYSLLFFFLNKTFNSFPRENKNMQAPRKSIESLCMFSKLINYY